MEQDLGAAWRTEMEEKESMSKVLLWILQADRNFEFDWLGKRADPDLPRLGTADTGDWRQYSKADSSFFLTSIVLAILLKAASIDSTRGL